MLSGVSGMKVLRCRKGVAAIELAIVLPILVLIIFGIIEFGLLLYNKQVITNASREGARAGIVSQKNRLTLAQIGSVVTTYCQNHLITFATGTLPSTTFGTGGGPCTGFGAPLDVVVTYSYKFLVMSSLVPGLSPTLNLSAETKMLCE